MPGPAPCLRADHGFTHLRVDDAPFLVIGGELHNSAASSTADIRTHFEGVAKLGLHTVLAPVAWETLEPAEGRFDFTLLDAMLDEARRQGLRLIPLWFGTYKNASSSYTPEWVKRDTARFPRAHTTPGHSGTAISPLSTQAVEADASAFAAMMRHLREREADAGHHTVVMVQVENEPGILKASRDRSPEAEEAFAAEVPTELLDALAKRRADARSEALRGAGAEASATDAGTWAEVFGDEADEVFMAWHVARFLDRVAEAGRGEYDLPLFANAWIKAGPGYKPGEYPSGGPTAEMLDVWKAAAPHLDLIAVDIYHDNFREICGQYHRPDNPLFVPESRPDASAGSRLLYVLGAHRGIGLCPFGIDDLTDPAHPLAVVARQIAAMTGTITNAQARNGTRGFLQEAEGETMAVELQGVRFTASSRFPHDPERPANAALLISLGDDEFLLLGTGLRIDLAAADTDDRTIELLHVFEGSFADDRWQPHRRLNGDETDHGTRLLLGREPQLLRFKLFSYT